MEKVYGVQVQYAMQYSKWLMELRGQAISGVLELDYAPKLGESEELAPGW